MTAGKTILFLGADAEYAFNFRRALMTGMRARGYRVVVAATPLKGFDPAAFADIGVEFLPWEVRKAGLDPLGDAASILRLRALMQQVRPSILFAHTIKPVIYGGVMGWLLGVQRRVAMAPGLGHAFMPPETVKHRIAGMIARLGYKFVLSRMDVTIFHNHDDIAELRRLGVIDARVKVARVYGSGVDMTHFAPQPLAPGPVTFLMVARLLREKGIFEFVEAAQRVKAALPEARFIVVGARDSNPSAVSDTQIEAWQAQGLVEFRGRLDDPRPAFAACHVFVLPSHREGTPRTNLEAMAMARAIITTDAPGCRETVRDGENGFLVPVGDVTALSDAMIALGRDRVRAQAMGERGREICAELYEIERVSQATIALIEGEAP